MEARQTRNCIGGNLSIKLDIQIFAQTELGLLFEGLRHLGGVEEWFSWAVFVTENFRRCPVQEGD